MSALPLRAIVLAAGLGTRMRPLTEHIPKPLVQVAGKALIDHVLDWLAVAGIEQAVVNTHYLAPLLEAHLVGRLAPAITFSHEPDLLETGGGILKALPLLGEGPLVAANSDTICVNGPVHAVSRLVHTWDDAAMDALLLLHPVDRAIGYDGPGDFSLTEDHSLVRRAEGAPPPYVFTGVQLVHPRLFFGAPAGPFSMNLLYNRGMREGGMLPRIKGLVHDGAWLHVGDPAAIALAEAAIS